MADTQCRVAQGLFLEIENVAMSIHRRHCFFKVPTETAEVLQQGLTRAFLQKRLPTECIFRGFCSTKLQNIV